MKTYQIFLYSTKYICNVVIGRGEIGLIILFFLLFWMGTYIFGPDFPTKHSTKRPHRVQPKPVNRINPSLYE